MKDFFGWLLVITRRTSQYSEASKTQRGIYGLSIVLMIYTAGLLSDIAIITNKFVGFDFLGDISLGSLIGNSILGVGILSVLLPKFIYSENVIKYYIEKYKPASAAEDKMQRKQVFLFISGAWVTFSSPLLIYWLCS